MARVAVRRQPGPLRQASAAAAVALLVLGVAVAGNLTSRPGKAPATLPGAGTAICILILSEKSTGSLACPTTGCAVVQRSAYAHVFGMPLALAGLLGYLAVGGTLLLHGWRGRAAAAGLATGGALFALFVAVQVFVIDAVCLWCVVNDTLAVAIAAPLCIRLVRGHANGALRV